MTWKRRKRGTRRQLGKKFKIEDESSQSKRAKLPKVRGKRKRSKKHPKVPKYLYHGTSMKRLEQIKAEGLKPRKPAEDKWKPVEHLGLIWRIGKRGALISFTDYWSACHWAKREVEHSGGTPIVLKLDTRDFDGKIYYKRSQLLYDKKTGRLREADEFVTRKSIPMKDLKILKVRK
jgi:hypothetical protein